MNELVLARMGGVDGVKHYVNALKAAAVAGGGDGKPILKIDKRTGDWSFGEDDEPLRKGDLLAINPLSFHHGYIAFTEKGDRAETEDGQIADISCPISDPLTRMGDLPELSQPKRGKPTEWKFTMSVEMAVVEGPNKGAEVIYKPTSRGGLKFLRLVVAEIARRMEAGKNEFVPVIELFHSTYEHKTYGTCVNPEFEIVDWVTMDAETFDAPVKDAPKKGNGKAIAKRRDEPEEDEQPRGRKGREDRKTRDADEDEKPARNGRSDRRARDEEPEEDDRRPAARGRRARDDEDDEPEQPRQSSRARRDEEDEEENRGVRGKNAARGRRAA
jgi:hypothetical protein